MMDRTCFAQCAEVANTKDSTLVKTSRALTRERQDFFLAIYAAMRTLDDFVDEDFLARQPSARLTGRIQAKSYIGNWLRQMKGLHGNFLNRHIAKAVQQTVGQSNLDLTLFEKFATSMTDDVEERVFESWGDFLEYCAGATVAPTAIFVYMLACDTSALADEPNCYRYTLPQPPEHYARDMAVFCYIVHILRDLAVDALQTRRLLTVPSRLLTEASLTAETLKTFVKGKQFERLLPLTEALVRKANEHLELGQRQTAELVQFLGSGERLALERLYNAYELLKDVMDADYVEYSSRPTMIQNIVQEQVFGVATSAKGFAK